MEGLVGCDYIALIPYKYCRVRAANALVHVTRTSNAEKAPDMTLECEPQAPLPESLSPNSGVAFYRERHNTGASMTAGKGS